MEQQLVDEARAGDHQVLAVVQDEEDLAIHEVVGQLLQHRTRGPVPHPQGRRDGVRHPALVLDGGQAREPDTVRKGPPGKLGGPNREPRLAHSPRAR